MGFFYFISSSLLLALLVGALAAWLYNSPAGSTASRAAGLSCFSVQLPETGEHKSCNDMCAAKNAVCTGLTSAISPAPSCSDAAGGPLYMCRCCAAGR